jgi:predicted transcriptional regulator of viral defense system
MKQIGVEYIRESLAEGRYTFTRPDVAKALNRQRDALNKILLRLKRAGWILPIGDDFFTIVDPQNRRLGHIPPEWFVDPWAKFKGVEYYVGGLSAAALHGAAHQRPQTFQVVVNRSMRSFTLPSLRVRFLYRQTILPSMWAQRKVPTGCFRVSTPEMTAYDLLSLRNACSSLDHVATVYVELGEAMRASRVAALCEKGFETPVLQRLGWMLDNTGWMKLTDGLAKRLAQRRHDWIPLHTRLPRDGARNPKWRVIENTDIQPDIQPGDLS